MRTPTLTVLAVLALLATLVLPAPGAIAAGDVTKLVGLPDGGAVTRVAVGPDDDVVAYLARCGGCNVEALYAVGLREGAIPVELSVLSDGAVVFVDRFSFTTDGRQLLFAGQISGRGPGPADHALFRVPTDGSAPPTRMSTPNDSIVEVIRWAASPDGRTLVYMLGDLNRSTRGINAVPLTGDQGDVIPLSSGGFLMGVSDTHVVYEDGTVRRVPLSGPAGAAEALTPADVSVYRTAISTDGEWVVYSATPDLFSTEESLYSVPTDGSATPTLLFADAGDDTYLDEFVVGRDGNRVVYLVQGGSDLSDADRLISVPIGGPASAGVQLNGPATGSSAIRWPVQLTPDGGRILFAGYEEYEGPSALVSAPVSGPASQAITLATTDAGVAIGAIEASQDGSRAAWTLSRDYDYTDLAVYGAPADGTGPAVELSRPTGSGTLVGDDSGGISLSFSPDGDVLFTGVQGTSDSMELHRVPAAGPASAGQPVNDPLVAGGDVFDFDTTSDGEVVVYIADQDTDDLRELYAAGPLGSGEPATVERWFGANRHATAAAVSAQAFDPDVDVAYIAVASGFPDALAGVAATAVSHGPILLTDRDVLPDATRTELQRLTPRRIVILGGEGVVSPQVEAALASFTPGGVSRLAGAGRYETAAAVSAATFQPGVPVAYVAVGTNYPDALAGGPAAGREGGPILLTAASLIPDATAAELQRLQPGRIVILGGPGVVSADVEMGLAAFTAGSVSRLSGASRFETAATVSAATFGVGVPIVLVAAGGNFPDALAGGPAAILLGGPILLVEGNSVPDATAGELLRLRPARIVILGGEGVVGPGVATQLAAFLS